MKQYLISATDFKDENALQRRLQARPAHLENVKKLKSAGQYVIGGALLNDNGNMIGSTIIVQFENLNELQNWLQADPYVTKKVWEHIEIKPFKVADF